MLWEEDSLNLPPQVYINIYFLKEKMLMPAVRPFFCVTLKERAQSLSH